MTGINIVKDFLIAHWADILVVVLFIAVLIGLWIKGYKKQVKKVILDLVAKAEAELGSGTGPIKYLRVTRWIYSRMPWVVKIFISEEELDDWIELAVKQLEKFLEEGGDLLTYQEERARDKVL